MEITQESLDTNKVVERDAEVDKIYQIVEIIIAESGKENQEMMNALLDDKTIDIDISNEISEILMAVFKCLRMEENDQVGHEKYLAKEAKLMGATMSISSVVTKIKTKDIKLDFEISTQIVELMTLFKSYFDEVRTGLSKFKIKNNAKNGTKRDVYGYFVGKPKEKKSTGWISEYGLSSPHFPLLQGITLEPERRTAVIRRLGPLTQCILLHLEDKYPEKIRDALMQSLQMLPMAHEICDVLQNQYEPYQVSGILSELAEILLLVRARSVRNFNFPLMYLLFVWKQPTLRPQWSFSCPEMMKVFAHNCKDGLNFRIRSNADPLTTNQCVFHVIFGTYLNDLKTLETITSHKGLWLDRKQMNPVFLKRSSANSVTFEPIYLRMVPKMAQTLPAKSLRNVGVATSRPSFAGFRKRHFTEEFLAYLGKFRLAFSSDPIHLLSTLRKFRDQLYKDEGIEKFVKAQIVHWEELQADGTWAVSNVEIVEGKSIFFGLPF